jgi:DNA helicase-2/ATP-dependent DNA helicase PcrA
VARFYIAHEFGHHRLHSVKASCGDDDLDAWTPAEPEESAVGEGDAYSPKQRSEAQANLFAREFLIPRDKLRARCELEKINASALGVELGIPENLVLQQMADALLLPDEPPRQPRKPVPEPDPSQLEAIAAPAGPRQVRAGPGTGKTRTLVSRIGYLLDHGEKPTSILALTYSNESSQDLALRIRAAVGEPSAGIWTGTFHAFGLELLRRYWAEIGPNDVPKLLDRSEALFLLEELLPELDLNFYLDLYEPLRALKSVLGAIGRAKDELCGPQQYFELASAMSSSPQNHTEAAAKALEVAQVYRIYDEALRSRGLLDFGDLISRTVELMRSRPPVASEIRGEFRHVLVDEYQDVNHASGELLRELVEPGQGPWVVGDVKQSIYRFRGASPLNMSRFESRFPGAQHTDLEVNYRSGGKIVRTFEAFGLKMQSAHLSTTKPLKAHRGDNSGRVDFNVATTREAEYEGIAQRITAHEASGGALRDNAILARSHTTLVKLSSHLERAGIASLYFGDFFERSEIRDLLCLLSVASERDGVGLVRVGQ